MNPVFWILVILGMVILWFIISFAFIPFGTILFKKWDKTLEILNKEINENEEEKEKEHE